MTDPKPAGRAGASDFPQVFGKYVLLRPMARGGMGELFLAAAGETGGYEKLCVVKRVIGDITDAGVHRRFLDEAKVVVRLNHPNLVQVFDAGLVGDDNYLAMELVEGKDLRAVWNRCAQLHRRIPVDFAIFVTREICRGLDYVHDAMGLDLVHRDISPPNILVAYHGAVKITDFGLAKHAIKREMTSPGVVFGRFSYLSPEQARGLPADRRSDIYATGIMLWEMLTGRQLFPGDGRGGAGTGLAQLRQPTIRRPSEIVPGIPPGLDDIVLKALAVERDARYANAGEFRAALSEVLSHHFPTCDVDRVSAFMKDVFAGEIKAESTDYANYAREDFSRVRAQARPGTRTVSVTELLSDVMVRSGATGPHPAVSGASHSGLRAQAGDGTQALEIGDSDVVELEERKPGAFEPPSQETLAREAQARVGTVLARRYRVERLLGVGGMGAVYEVTHMALGKTFALKVLHAIYGRDPDIIDRFVREARAATQTGHPNIIDVMDIGTMESGELFFVMELLSGADLGTIVEEQGPFAIRRVVHVGVQICRALAAAHDVGIIHRDLKSENVILQPRQGDPDFVKVLDFGICKQVGGGDSSRTTPGMVMGSPDYMAPEQAAGAGADVASDVYALGTILYHLLTGRLPFRGRNAIDVLMQKGAREAPRVRALRGDVPEALDDVVARCLARDPEARPATMQQLEYELTRALEGRAAAVARRMGLPMPDDGRDEAMPTPPVEVPSLPIASTSASTRGREANPPAQLEASRAAASGAASVSGVHRTQARDDGDAVTSVYAVDERGTQQAAAASRALHASSSGTGARPVTREAVAAGAAASGARPRLNEPGVGVILARALVFIVLGGLLVGVTLIGVDAGVFGGEPSATTDESPSSTREGERRGSDRSARSGETPTAGEGGVVGGDGAADGAAVGGAGDTTGSPSTADNPAGAGAGAGAASSGLPPPPMPTGKTGTGKSAAAAGEDVTALVEAAETALEGGHFREPLEGSLALALMQLSLAEPGNEAIARLRREAATVLVPRGEKAMKKKQWLEAAAAWRDLVAVWPDHPTAKEPYVESLQRAGSILRKSGDHEEALALADELLVQNPESFFALVLRGDACVGLERYLDAVNAYRSAMRLKPRDKALKKKYWRARGKLGPDQE